MARQQAGNYYASTACNNTKVIQYSVATHTPSIMTLFQLTLLKQFPVPRSHYHYALAPLPSACYYHASTLSTLPPLRRLLGLLSLAYHHYHRHHHYLSLLSLQRSSKPVSVFSLRTNIVEVVVV